MGQRGPKASTVTDRSEDPFHKRADPPKLTHFNQFKTLRFILTIKNKNKTGVHFFICFFLFLKSFALCLSFYKHKSYHCLYVFLNQKHQKLKNMKNCMNHYPETAVPTIERYLILRFQSF